MVAGLLAGSIVAQTPQIKENSLYGYCMASTWTTDKFSSANGGISLGTIISIDADRKLSLRTGYSSLNFGENNDVQLIEIMPLLSWYIGEKWTFYATGGICGYVSGPDDGIDARGGFGASRRLWTDNKFVGKIPASFDIFGELILTQARDQITNGYMQVNLGIRFGKSE
jgi:hypothetical protein